MNIKFQKKKSPEDIKPLLWILYKFKFTKKGRKLINKADTEINKVKKRDKKQKLIKENN